jgi:S-adenosylmethionine decarboxylase
VDFLCVDLKGKGVEMHLIIDGFTSNPQLLEDEGLIYQLLDSYPAQIGMTKVAPPHVLRYVGSKLEDWGVTGFVIIAESHISIHTFPARRYVNIDVFSCKDFDSEQAIKDLQARFELTELRSYLLKRGLEYSHIETLELERL